MNVSEPVGALATGCRLPFSQGGGEAGRSASFLGFTRRALPFVATQVSRDRLSKMPRPDHWALSEAVIGACIEVHRQLGPGRLENVYELALCEELTLRDIPFVRQFAFPVTYKGRDLEQNYRIDLVVASHLVVEVKSVDALLPTHTAQVLTYLRLTGLESGLLVNFNADVVRSGLRRLSLTPRTSRTSPPPRLPVKSRPAKSSQQS
jgi:GxxExxY protein